MKRVICILFVLLTTNLFALEVDLGGKLGLGVGWWRGDDYTEDVDVMGAPNFNFGASTSFEVHKNVALQFELLFALVGNEDEKRYEGLKVSRNYYNSSFQIPVFLKPKFEVGPGDMFFLVGPRFMILLNDFTVRHKLSSNNISYESETDYEIGRQFQLGLSFGFGYDLKLGPGKLQFYLDITPFLTNYGNDYDRAIQNEANFNIGYAFTFK